MAATVLSLITRIRKPINDIDADEYPSSELLDYINQANRLVYSAAMMYRPLMITDDPVTGNTVAGTSLITLPKTPAKFVDVRVNTKPIKEIKITDISDLTTQGTPRRFFPFQMNKIQMYPIPDRVYAYSIYYVPECPALEEGSSIIWPTNFEDAMVEYCVSRAPMRNNYNMSQEAALTSVFSEKIINLLTCLTDHNAEVQGYY